MRITKHPIVEIPSDDVLAAAYEQGGDKRVQELLEAREERIRLAADDPLNHGFRFPSWNLIVEQLQKYMEVFAFGGNGSSKSEIGAFLVDLCLVHNPGARIYCFAQDDSASTQIQQRYVHRYLPPLLRAKQMSETGYMKYSIKNGFTDDSFILDMNDGTEPRECYFFKYSQYQANKSKFEGYEYGAREPKSFNLPEQKMVIDGKEWIIPAMNDITLNIGAWPDEYLENGELYNTLLYRIPRRGASILTTFTPINHMTAFVADKIKGSRVTKTISTSPMAFGQDGDPREVEWVREKRNSDRDKAGVGMVFFPSQHNPWAGFENMCTLHSHKALSERLVRFHGIPSNVITSLFPKFNTDVHVVKERWKPNPKLNTCYMVADPAGKRSYSNLWALVDGDGYVQIQAEFPQRSVYGEWAIFGSPRWKYGPASHKHIMSTRGYVDEWTKIEDDLGVEPAERIGDSRAFATEDDNSVDRFCAFAEHDMHFVPSDGRVEEIGLQMLDEWFDYDVTQPVDAVNRPLLTIHESCGNLIDSILHYNSEGKMDEALKDFIDLLRYLRMANAGEGPIHFDPDALGITQLTKGGY